MTYLTKYYKQVKGIEPIDIDNKTYNCYKIEYSWDDPIFVVFYFFDYISYIGMVKRISTADRMKLTFSNDTKVLYMEYYETITLTKFHLN